MVVRDEGEKNKWIGRSETDHYGKLPDAHSGHLPHWPLYSQKNGTTKCVSLQRLMIGAEDEGRMRVG